MKNIRRFLTVLRYWNTWKIWLLLSQDLDYGSVYWVDWSLAVKLAKTINDD